MTRERFIPFRKADLVELLCGEGSLGGEDTDRFRRFCALLASIYHFDFHKTLEFLKDNYAPFDPDADTTAARSVSDSDKAGCEARLREAFERVLTHANFQKIGAADLELAMREKSLFKVSLRIDFEDFDDTVLYWRGTATRKVAVRDWRWRPREIDVASFERVAMFIKFKNAAYFASKKRKDLGFEPGTMAIKLFRSIPKADIEMLFPNATVGMTTKDKLLLAIPGLAGGVGVLAKAGAALLGAVGIVGLLIQSFWNAGVPQYPSPTEMAKVVGGLVAVATLGAYFFKQWTNYKNRKLAFMKTLTDNLYFRNLDNNAGVFHRLIDSAEEEECKEAMLAYYFLLVSAEGDEEDRLDRRIEAWFSERHGTAIDFEIEDALRKLKDLSLCLEATGPDGSTRLTVLPLAEACRRLDAIWDGYFDYSAQP